MKTLHLSLQSIKPTLFLFRQQNFIKISHALLRQTEPTTQGSKMKVQKRVKNTFERLDPQIKT